LNSGTPVEKAKSKRQVIERENQVKNKIGKPDWGEDNPRVLPDGGERKHERESREKKKAGKPDIVYPKSETKQRWQSWLLEKKKVGERGSTSQGHKKTAFLR